jgi:hypothetical protein
LTTEGKERNIFRQEWGDIKVNPRAKALSGQKKMKQSFEELNLKRLKANVQIDTINKQHKQQRVN